MRAIVTGGAGFIGSHIVELLLRVGYNVLSIDNLSNGQSDNVNIFLDNPNYSFLKLDLSKDFDDSCFKGVDYVFHAAALADIVPSIERPIDYHQANVTATVRVLGASNKHKVRKFYSSYTSPSYSLRLLS